MSDDLKDGKAAAIKLAEDCGAKVYPCDGEVVFFRYQFHQFVDVLLETKRQTTELQAEMQRLNDLMEAFVERVR